MHVNGSVETSKEMVISSWKRVIRMARPFTRPISRARSPSHHRFGAGRLALRRVLPARTCGSVLSRSHGPDERGATGRGVLASLYGNGVSRAVAPGLNGHAGILAAHIIIVTVLIAGRTLQTRVRALSLFFRKVYKL